MQKSSSKPFPATYEGGSPDNAASAPARQAALDAVASRRRFELRAIVLTLLACTGVIMYWRGVWSLWCAPPGPPQGLCNVLCRARWLTDELLRARARQVQCAPTLSGVPVFLPRVHRLQRRACAAG